MLIDSSCRIIRSALSWSLIFGSILPAAAQDDVLPLTESKIVEVINLVNVLTGEDLEAIPAEPEMLFQAPDFLETGRRSRARLEAEDGTITRIGSNTLFSFDDLSRTINLKRGSILFHSPEGRGGGRVVTASATASVLGTTIVVAATDNGGFKLLVLEGVADIVYPDGTFRRLNAGQMTFVMPDNTAGGSNNSGQGQANNNNNSNSNQGSTPSGGSSTGGTPGPVVNFDLERMQEGSGLLNGFSTTLPSAPKIALAVRSQQVEISEGGLQSTDAIIVGAADSDSLEIITIDATEFNESNPELAFSVDEEGNLVPDDTLESGEETDEVEQTPEEILDAALAASANPSEDGFAEANLFDFPGVILDLPELEGSGIDFGLYGFIAGDITFDEGDINISDIGISPDGGSFTEYNIFALDSLAITGDLTLSGFGENAIISMLTLGDLTLTPGSDITVDSNSSSLFELATFNGATFTDSEITNLNGSIDLATIDDEFVLNGASISAQGSLGESSSPFQGDVVNQLAIQSDEAALRIVNGSALVSSGSLYLDGVGVEISDASTVTAVEDTFIRSEGFLEMSGNSSVDVRDIYLDADTDIELNEVTVTAEGILVMNNFSLDRTDTDEDRTNTPITAAEFEEILIESSALSGAQIEVNSRDLIDLIDSTLVAEDYLLLNGDSQVVVSTGSSLSAERIELFSNSTFSINASVVSAGEGGVDLSAIDGLDISAGSEISGENIVITSGDDRNDDDIEILNTSEFAIDGSDTSLVARDGIQISTASIVRIDAASVQADFLEIDAETIKSQFAHFDVNQLELRAVTEIAMDNADLRDLNRINMSARTLILSDIQFSSNTEIHLGSEFGLLAPDPNTGAAAATGYVNFIENVTLNGSPAQNFVSTDNGGISSEANAEIFIYTTTVPQDFTPSN